MYLRSSTLTPCVDEEEKELATTWSVVDEVAYRGKLSPQMIFDGKIKLKNRCLITRLSERAIHFDDGSELAADVIVFATG